VAYAQLRVGPAPPTIRDEATIELWRFYVDLPHHGRGLAHELMAVALEAAQARGAATMWLGVWEKNHRAQAFYRKFGFVDVGAHEFRLGNDLQTDRVMVTPLTPIATHRLRR
jgi:ribosomal protein S18 acetylase RimI-like enzyme